MVSPRSFPARFREFCARERLVRAGETVIAGVSGGVDSMVLLELLARGRDRGGYALEVAHVNHALRGTEADGDEELVRQRARLFGLPFHATRVDTAAAARTSDGGLQLAARKLRYEYFARLRDGRRNVRVATAHHADDNAETVLMNLLRGSGVRGMGGIPVRRDDQGVIRPLLFAEREEIEAFAAAERVPFRVDRSNETDDYTRNVLRRHVITALRERLSPSVARTLLRESRMFRAVDGYLAEQCAAALAGVRMPAGAGAVALAAGGLAALHPVIAGLVVRAAIEECTGRSASAATVGAVAELLHKPTGTLQSAGGAFVALRDRDTLLIRPLPAEPRLDVLVPFGSGHEGSGFTLGTEVREGGVELLERRGAGEELLDADLIPGGALRLRTWRPGDAFMPLGMQALKKLSDYFVAARVPRLAKAEVPLLVTLDGRIACLCGGRIDERFRLTAGTRRVLAVAYRRTTDTRNAEDHHPER